MNSILTTLASLTYRQTLLLEVLKSSFQRHGSEVQVGSMYPSLHSVSTLNNNAATWLHTSPSLQMLLHDLYNFYREDTTNPAMHVTSLHCDSYP